MSYLGLPPIPPDLKPITSYLQRAHETRAQDPVISYWCMGTYYAAQVGISLKAVSTPNRNFLAALLTTLENLRSVVGSSDAITVESASSAYVENFALLVFASADDEDRRGIATRKTAKKFLAAATFFEVLNVFEDRGPWEAHEEKGRYAKWRAADISKALREGRQPTPVSNGGD
ncbi:Vta1 like-domain-containing protein, partial [Multifurca ochricompacta]